jgi:hypothetical protein
VTSEPKTPGRKDDTGKPRYDLLPAVALHEVVRVLTYGAGKYAPENWRKVEDWRPRYFAAAMRHLWAWFRGERIDPESTYPHLAHAACCILFMLELECCAPMSEADYARAAGLYIPSAETPNPEGPNPPNPFTPRKFA